MVEAWVQQQTQGVGEFRLALSRNDAWATVAHMLLRDQLLTLLSALIGLRETVLGMASEDRSTLCMAYTARWTRVRVLHVRERGCRIAGGWGKTIGIN